MKSSRMTSLVWPHSAHAAIVQLWTTTVALEVALCDDVDVTVDDVNATVDEGDVTVDDGYVTVDNLAPMTGRPRP